MEAPVPSLAFFSNSGNNLKYTVFFAHKGKSNTSFGTVKGLLLFVCTHNINNDSQCFYKINRKTEDALSAVSWTGALHNEQKLSELPHTWYIQVHLNKLECREKVHFFL